MSRIPRSWLYAALLPDWPPPALTRPVNHIPLRLTVHYSMVEMAGIEPASTKRYYATNYVCSADKLMQQAFHVFP